MTPWTFTAHGTEMIWSLAFHLTCLGLSARSRVAVAILRRQGFVSLPVDAPDSSPAEALERQGTEAVPNKTPKNHVNL